MPAFFKFTASSLISSVVEEVLFVVATGCFSGFLTGFALTAIPTVVARVLSSLVNFWANQKLVFQSNSSTKKALERYTIMAVPQLLAQIGLTYGIFRLFAIGAEQVILRGAIHALVMTILFCICYVVQKRWVFAQEENEE